MSLSLDANHDLYLGSFSGIAVAEEGAAVAQGILTRLRLIRGEWFLDTSAGMPWFDAAFSGTKDPQRVEREVKQRIFDTPGVDRIVSFQASIDPATRELTLTFEVDTIYGPSGVLQVSL